MSHLMTTIQQTGSPTVHQALRVPELLDFIFSNGLQPKELLSVALACRFWTEVALNRLWRDLPSIRPLIDLLAPLETFSHSSGAYKWGEWSRFKAYANRVQSLSILTDRDNFNASVFSRFRQLDPTGDILPKLRNLHLYGTPDSYRSTTPGLSLFLGTTIHTITFHAIRTDLESRASFLELLPRHVPHLQALTLGQPSDADGLEACIRGLPELRLLECCRQNITPSLWDAVSSYIQLDTLTLNYWEQGGTVDFSASKFQALRHLNLAAAMEDLLDVLKSGDCPLQLQSLWLTVAVAGHPEASGQALFDAIGRGFSQLTSLKVDFEGKKAQRDLGGLRLFCPAGPSSSSASPTPGEWKSAEKNWSSF